MLYQEYEFIRPISHDNFKLNLKIIVILTREFNVPYITKGKEEKISYNV